MLQWWVEYLKLNYLHVSLAHPGTLRPHVHYVHCNEGKTHSYYWSDTQSTYFQTFIQHCPLILNAAHCVLRLLPSVPLWRCLGVNDRRLSGGGARRGHRVQGRMDLGWRGDVDVVPSQDPCSGDETLFETKARLGPPSHVPLVCVYTHIERQLASLSNNTLCLD